jgi:hypothetical protein
MNSVIAGATWGEVGDDGEWRAKCTRPSVTRPEPALCNYLWHLEHALPGKPHKVQRDGLASCFTHAGAPGERMRPHYERLMASLLLPPHLQGSPQAKVTPTSRMRHDVQEAHTGAHRRV